MRIAAEAANDVRMLCRPFERRRVSGVVLEPPKVRSIAAASPGPRRARTACTGTRARTGRAARRDRRPWRRSRGGQRLTVAGERARRIAKRVARELIEQQHAGQRLVRMARQSRVAAGQRGRDGVAETRRGSRCRMRDPCETTRRAPSGAVDRTRNPGFRGRGVSCRRADAAAGTSGRSSRIAAGVLVRVGGARPRGAGLTRICPSPARSTSGCVRPSRPDRPARVQLVGRDADLGAEPVLEAVGEARRGVDHHRARVDLAQEAHRARVVLGDDRVGVLRAVLRDVRDRLVERVDDAHREDRRQVLGVPVVLGRAPSSRARARASARSRAARRPSPRRLAAAAAARARRCRRARAASPSCCTANSAASWRCRRCGSPSRGRRARRCRRGRRRRGA